MPCSQAESVYTSGAALWMNAMQESCCILSLLLLASCLSVCHCTQKAGRDGGCLCEANLQPIWMTVAVTVIQSKPLKDTTEIAPSKPPFWRGKTGSAHT